MKMANIISSGIHYSFQRVMGDPHSARFAP
jgi:hypothetical protein